jgi:UDP-glucose 4-epimerase
LADVRPAHVEATPRSRPGLKALVTGGAGFIGHHLVAALLDQGDDVVVLDDLSTGDRSRLERFGGDVDLLEGSILDATALDRALAGCEVVFHEAAIPSVARSLLDPMTTHDVNVGGTINLMLAAARAGIRRVVFAGSSSVYGVPATLPCREDMAPAPESPYGVSKLAAEHDLHVLGRHAGIETVALRYFNVFGPGQDPHSEYSAVIPRFITAVLEGRRPTINGSGEISRDFTYVENVIAGNLLAATAAVPSGFTANVACGDRISLLELLDAVCDAVGGRVEPIFGPPRPGDIVHSQADISRAQAVLGYRVRVTFREGIVRTVSWYRDQGGVDGPAA